MTPDRLLRLYPRAWRERYGEEFLATTGPDTLSLQQVVDIVSGAIDAWLSADVQSTTRAANAVAAGGSTMTVRAMICRTKNARYTTKDSLIGAAIMIALAAIFALTGNAAARGGWTVTGEMLKTLSFSIPFSLSMPFWLMKGQPWKAQVAIVGGTTAFLIVIGYVAAVT
jgi:hypothetical protein